MAHDVSFRQFEPVEKIIEKREVIDLIEALYDGPDSKFIIDGSDDHKKRRGAHVFERLTSLHVIMISVPNIRRDMKSKLRMGGNRIPVGGIKGAVASVLMHEVRHAYQAAVLSNAALGGSMNAGKYMGRPCEVDARRFVDEHEDVIMDVIGVPRRQTNQTNVQQCTIDDVIAMLKSDGIMQINEVRDALRAVGMNNVKNIQIVMAALKSDA